jgi:uncharacterized protein involved in exopolysaccharide biosynthesis
MDKNRKKGDVPAVPSEGSRLPRESASRNADLAQKNDRPGANDYFGVYEPSPPVFGFTLGDLILVLKQRRLFLLVGALAGVGLAILVLAVTSPLYAVSAQVVITQQTPGQLIDTDSGSSAFIATQAEVIQSLTVVQAAVATLPPPSYLGPEDDAVLNALGAVHASAITGTRVIALGYLGADAKYGAALLNAMVDVYVTEVRSTIRSGQAKLLDTKSAEYETLMEEIASLESRINDLRRANGVIGNADEAAAAQASQLKIYAENLMEVRNRRIELENRLATGVATMTADDPLRNSLRQDLRQAESELAKARRSLTAEHPAVVTAERNVKVLRAQLASIVGGSLGIQRQQINEAARLEAELVILEAESRTRLEVIELHRREENKLLADLVRMQSQADEWRRELFDQQVVARLAQAGDVGIGARIIEEPVLPEQPVWPKKKIMVLAGTVFGLAVGFLCALVSLRRQRDPGVVKW